MCLKKTKWNSNTPPKKNNDFVQQHRPDCCDCTDWPGVMVVDLAAPDGVAVEPILCNQEWASQDTSMLFYSTDLSLICFAIVKKACSTFVALFAEVSRKVMPSWSANSYNEYKSYCSMSGPSTWQTFATVYSTTFLPVRSDLFPTRSLLTPSDAYLSISCNHCFTLVKVSRRCHSQWTWRPDPNRLVHTVVGNIIHNDNAMCATVIGRCNGPKSLLAWVCASVRDRQLSWTDSPAVSHCW